MTQVQPPSRLIKITDVLKLVPYSRSHLWRLEKNGQFPRRVRIGLNRVAWIESEIAEWIKQRSEKRDPNSGYCA